MYLSILLCFYGGVYPTNNWFVQLNKNGFHVRRSGELSAVCSNEVTCQHTSNLQCFTWMGRWWNRREASSLKSRVNFRYCITAWITQMTFVLPNSPAITRLKLSVSSNAGWRNTKFSSVLTVVKFTEPNIYYFLHSSCSAITHGRT